MGLFNSKCTSTLRLDGKTAIITGANTGIGKETAKDFFKRGARVIVACRSLEKANEAVQDIKQQCLECENLGQLLVIKLDLASLASVRTCAKSILESEESIHLLINNAGVMVCPQSKTEDGFEMQFGVNHLGHFLFTLLLLPKICDSAPARIINVSADAYKIGHLDLSDLNWERRNYSAVGAYAQSKLAELATRLKDVDISGVTVYSLHPGVIATELGRHVGTTYSPVLAWLWRNVASSLIKTPEQGAQTTIYCAVHEKCALESGLYYSGCSVVTVSRNAKKTEDARMLWNESLKLVGLDETKFTFV